MADDPIPIAKPYIGVEEARAVEEVLRSRWLTQGPRVAEFEAAFASYVGAPHAIAVTSCTTALHLALMAIGVGAGDEVICPSLSFIATANVVVQCGATPVFVDVDPRTYNLSPAATAHAVTPRTKAILAAHQIGMPVDLDELVAISRDRGIPLVEDGACAVGSRYRGVPVGKPHGVACCFSFHPRKILTTGEGGMITTNNEALARRLRRLRHHGMTISDLDRHHATAAYVRESYEEVGYNYRMTDLQAAVGLVQLRRLDDMLKRRRAQAVRYDEALRDVRALATPHVPPDRSPNYQSYMVRLLEGGREARDRVVNELLEQSITTRPGIAAAHRERPYSHRAVTLPETERAADETIVLPLYHEMTDDAQDRVVCALVAAISSTSPRS